MKYKLFDIITVTVSAISPYGIFVKAPYDYNGLIHISEITGRYVSNISKYFKIGSDIEAKIIGIDEEKKQLNLSTRDIIGVEEINKRGNLKEDGLGFKELKNMLPEWIDTTKKELENNK